MVSTGVGHRLADREVSRGARPRQPAATSRSVTMPTGRRAVARPRPSRPAGRACAARRLERFGHQCADGGGAHQGLDRLIVSIVRSSRRMLSTLIMINPCATMTAAEAATAARREGGDGVRLRQPRRAPQPPCRRRPVEPVRRRRRGGHRPAWSAAAGEPPAHVRGRDRHPPHRDRRPRAFASGATMRSSWRRPPRSNRSRSCCGPVSSRDWPSAPGPLCRWPCPRAAASGDRLRLVVDVAAMGDPSRGDLRPEAVAACGRSMIASVVESLPLAGDGRTPRLVLRRRRGPPGHRRREAVDAPGDGAAPSGAGGGAERGAGAAWSTTSSPPPPSRRGSRRRCGPTRTPWSAPGSGR